MLLQRPKVARTCGALCILTQTCASRHNGLHFLKVSTSKSAPRLRCFVHLDFETCFAPQLRTLFEHLNFQKCSEGEAFCTFWLRNVLRATTACTFSTSQLPKVVRHWDPPEPQTNGKTVFRDFPIPFRAPASSFFALFLFSDLLSSALLLSDSSHLCFSICPYCRTFDF